MGGGIFSWLLLFKALTLILKGYAIHKTINFIPEYIILMIIKSFCMHIRANTFLKTQILTKGIDKFIRQEIIEYFGQKIKKSGSTFCLQVSTYIVYVVSVSVCVDIQLFFF